MTQSAVLKRRFYQIAQTSGLFKKGTQSIMWQQLEELEVELEETKRTEDQARR
jgi:hypothetical protein